jgi:hypothetical protein
MSENFSIIATVKDGIAIGSKNIGPIFVNVLLWVLTLWIPYLNVGTTIGLMAGIVTKASRGEVIPVTEIFDPKYRKYMGEYFLTAGLIGVGVCIGTIFGIIPGVVIALAWSLAILLVVDKGKNPTEAITMSNNCTYGHKWKIFGIYFLVYLAFLIIVSILGGIAYAVNDMGLSFMISLFIVLIGIFSIFVFIGLQASIYKQLTEGV